MNFLWTIILCICFVAWSCKSRSVSESKGISPVTEAVLSYDSVRFNEKLTIDTIACGWLSTGRTEIGTLLNERASIKSPSSNKFFATKKYKRLLTCKIPSYIFDSNDTVLLTGKVYHILASDGGGFPAIITEIKFTRDTIK